MSGLTPTPRLLLQASQGRPLDRRGDDVPQAHDTLGPALRPHGEQPRGDHTPAASAGAGLHRVGAVWVIVREVAGVHVPQRMEVRRRSGILAYR